MGISSHLASEWHYKKVCVAPNQHIDLSHILSNKLYQNTYSCPDSVILIIFDYENKMHEHIIWTMEIIDSLASRYFVYACNSYLLIYKTRHSTPSALMYYSKYVFQILWKKLWYSFQSILKL